MNKRVISQPTMVNADIMFHGVESMLDEATRIVNFTCFLLVKYLPTLSNLIKGKENEKC